MENKKVPMRTCIACRECKPKSELIRIVKFENNFNVDFSGKMNGRGSYICNSDQCFEKLLKNKLLNKTYKQNISPEVYETLKEQYFERK